MIIKNRDPSSMSSKERLSEIAMLLAQAYIRLLFREESQNTLDDSTESEAPCDRLVNGNEAVPVVEVAL